MFPSSPPHFSFLPSSCCAFICDVLRCPSPCSSLFLPSSWWVLCDMPHFQAHESAPPSLPSVGELLFVTCYISELPVPPCSSPLVGESNVKLPTQTATLHALCHPQGCTHTLVMISDDKARQQTC